MCNRFVWQVPALRENPVVASGACGAMAARDAIMASLARVPGVSRVVADDIGGTVEVWLDPSSDALAAVAGMLSHLGYPPEGQATLVAGPSRAGRA
ncbi:MAG: heavy-metal-associated domain-containing protein [Chloroflexi bacterium]|nr:heavy-metal-associated domain-containing protein [Chloroflexota bacterium]